MSLLRPRSADVMFSGIPFGVRHVEAALLTHMLIHAAPRHDMILVVVDDPQLPFLEQKDRIEELIRRQTAAREPIRLPPNVIQTFAAKDLVNEHLSLKEKLPFRQGLPDKRHAMASAKIQPARTGAWRRRFLG